MRFANTCLHPRLPPVWSSGGVFTVLRVLALTACLLPGARAAGNLTVGQARLGNVFLVGEAVEIPVQTTGDRVEWTVTDFFGVTSAGTGVAVGQSGAATVRPAVSARKGYFELHLTARRAGAVVAQADTTFAVLPPPDPALKAGSPFGVMTHFAQGWNTDLMPLIARAGLRHIRDEQYWQNVEPDARGAFTFSSRNRDYMAAAAANGLEPLLEMTFGNSLYDHDPRAPATAFAPYTDEGRTGYANYGRALLGQYGAQVRTIEVWNEYNGSWCAGPAADDRPRAYAAMLRAAYERIKAARPDVRVLGGAAVLAPLPWFEDLFNAGALDSMDAAVIHPYRGVPEGVEKDVAALRDLTARYNHGAGPKPIWATECGTTDDAHPGRQEMARYLVRLLTLLRSAGVERIHWYLMRDHFSFTSGLLHSDQSPLGRYAPTAAYPAYANLVQQLGSAPCLRREPTDARTRVYLFGQGNAEVRVAWSTAPPSRLVLTTDTPVTVVDVMGESRVLTPTAGRLELTVDANPVYLRGNISALRETGRDLLLADSAGDFSGSQGEAPGTWSYGIYGGNPARYDPAAWQPMTWTRNTWGYQWQSPYPYSKIDEGGAHPSAGNGGQPIWAVRRWRSPLAATARITGQATRIGDGGDGTGVKIFVDGLEIFSQLLGAPGGGPKDASFDLRVPLRAGATVDFAVTPGPGVDMNFDATEFRAQITVPQAAATTFNDWRAGHFTAGELANAAISGDAADPDGDGIPNLLEYAFGLDPRAPDSAGLPTIGLGIVNSVTYLTLSFRQARAADLAYRVETSGDLGVNAWKPDGLPLGAPVDNGDGTDTVTYRDSVAVSAAPAAFYGCGSAGSEGGGPASADRSCRGEGGRRISLVAQMTTSFGDYCALGRALAPLAVFVPPFEDKLLHSICRGRGS